MFSCTYVIRI